MYYVVEGVLKRASGVSTGDTAREANSERFVAGG